jgi:hypothetical protein
MANRRISSRVAWSRLRPSRFSLIGSTNSTTPETMHIFRDHEYLLQETVGGGSSDSDWGSDELF